MYARGNFESLQSQLAPPGSYKLQPIIWPKNNGLTPFVVAVQQVVDDVFAFDGVVNSNLTDAGADGYVGSYPKLVRSSYEIRSPRALPFNRKITEFCAIRPIGA